MEKGIFICGSPATLREKLRNIRRRSASAICCRLMQFGSLPHELVTKSTEIFAKEVIPHFRRDRANETAASRASA
jgi:hypothetical protein